MPRSTAVLCHWCSNGSLGGKPGTEAMLLPFGPGVLLNGPKPEDLEPEPQQEDEDAIAALVEELTQGVDPLGEVGDDLAALAPDVDWPEEPLEDEADRVVDGVKASQEGVEDH